jgi:predicted nucleic acid-binding protein
LTPFVLDCSVTMAWCFDDEGTPYTEGIRDRLLDSRAVVPALWPLEVANVLLVGERRRRLRRADTARFIALLQGLPIVVVPGSWPEAVRGTVDLAREHGLSSYDAAYLELAVTEGLPLATVDDRLRKAAIRAGVPLAEQRQPR